MKQVFATFFFLASIVLMASILRSDYLHYKHCTNSKVEKSIVYEYEAVSGGGYVYRLRLNNGLKFKLFLNKNNHNTGDTLLIRYIDNPKYEEAKLAEMPDWFDNWIALGLFIIVYTLAIGLWVISKENLSKVIDAYVRFIEKLKFIK